MSILNVEHLTHGFGDRAIFTDVSFRLLKGEHIGLVGANGEGKSTFMNIVTGKLMPDEGKVEWSKNVHAGYLDQHAVLKQGMTIREVLKSAFDPLLQKEIRMNEICDLLGTADEEEMNLLMEELGTIQDELTLHDFYTIDAKVEEVARALGLLDLGLDRDVTDLSGGQRTKVLLAKLLLEKPDILLLDEPTNYLDEEHIAWLKRYLLDYENAFILISHDIPFLNEVVNIIYHMENQELNRYVGDYNHFQEVYAVKKAQLEAAYRRQQQEISELKDFVARNKARVSTRNMAMSRQKKLDKMDLIELAGERPKPEFHFRTARTSGRFVVTAKELVIGYEEPLSRPLTFAIERGEKIVLTGANGIGKTTLLNCLGLIQPIESGSILINGKDTSKWNDKDKTKFWHKYATFIYQDYGIIEDETVAYNITLDKSKAKSKAVKNILDKVGLNGRDSELAIVLSGGEKQRIGIARAILKNASIIYADEPTASLDSENRQIVISLLKECASNGAIVILATHDDRLVSECNKVISLNKNRN